MLEAYKRESTENTEEAFIELWEHLGFEFLMLLNDISVERIKEMIAFDLNECREYL